MSKKIFLILVLLAAAFINWPYLNFEDNLSQGDCGRDLYTYEQVLHGKMVYKDIWWVYGPLMPYYYGLCFLLFGFKITSVLLGKFFITLSCGLFFYLACAEVMPAFWAFLSSWFFCQSQQDFFFTYNHVAGIALTLAVFWLILKYFNTKNLRLGFWALAACFVLGLIKINFGITALAITLFSFAFVDYLNVRDLKKIWNDNTKLFYTCGLIIPLLWLGIYAFLFKDLTSYELHQCMPYFGDDQPYHRSPLVTIPYYLTQHWLTLYHHWINFQGLMSQAIISHPNLFNPVALLLLGMVTFNFLLHPLLHGSTIMGFILSYSKEFDQHRRAFWMTQMVIWLFFVLNFHEFIVTGIWYRTYWSQPFLLFFGFFMIVTALTFAQPWLRRSVPAFWLILLTMTSFVTFCSTKSASTQDKFLTMPRGQIYVSNKTEWVDTVNTVTNYLNKNLKKDELFFALPYDCLYYYLTGKPSPTRQLIFFNHIKIPPQQEISIIQELERNKVNYVLMSNRMASNEAGMGVLGKTYCPILFQYIVQNFAPLYRYGGNWQAEPGNLENHGVMILKRK